MTNICSIAKVMIFVIIILSFWPISNVAKQDLQLIKEPAFLLIYVRQLKHMGIRTITPFTFFLLRQAGFRPDYVPKSDFVIAKSKSSYGSNILNHRTYRSDTHSVFYGQSRAWPQIHLQEGEGPARNGPMLAVHTVCHRKLGMPEMLCRTIPSKGAPFTGDPSRRTLSRSCSCSEPVVQPRFQEQLGRYVPPALGSHSLGRTSAWARRHTRLSASVYILRCGATCRWRRDAAVYGMHPHRTVQACLRDRVLWTDMTTSVPFLSRDENM